MTQIAVHFGAGAIGRGFLGQLYYESGYHTFFVDVAETLLTRLRERGEYPIDIVSEDGIRRTTIKNVSAIHGGDRTAVADVLARASIASTAVGSQALPHIAPALAAGILRRFSDPFAAPLDILICENIKDGESHMRHLVRSFLPSAFHGILEEKVGFVEASIGRMAPVMTPDQLAEDPLLVCVEPYCRLPVDRAGFRGPIPTIKNIYPAAPFAAYVEQKLFVHNLSHAAAAYLGHLKGYDFIWQAIRDDTIRERVQAAACESCLALHRKYGMDAAALEEHRIDLIRRYHNRALGDQIARVGRDLPRKLGPNDRLIGAGRLCLEHGVVPDHIALATAAAILYDNPEDSGSRALQSVLHQDGIDRLLEVFCRLSPESPLSVLIRDAYHYLNTKKG